MLRIGIVGLGFMGMVHYLSYRKIPGCRVVAICDTHDERLRGDWTAIKGNFGPPGGQVDLAGVATFPRLEDMLEQAELDLVDVTLPTPGHAEATIATLESGRHAFCEKPMALALDDCDRMLAASGAAGRRMYVGQVLPYFPEFAWALDAVRDRRYGGLVGGRFRRVIADPTWVSNFWSPDVGGPLFDLHVHDAHFIRLLFGMPTDVVSEGSTRSGMPELWETKFRFADAALGVTATSGVHSAKEPTFEHGFEIQFERATLKFDFAIRDRVGRYSCPPTIVHPSGAVESVDLGNGDPMIAFEHELAEVVRCALANIPSELLNGQLARDAVALCARQQQSLGIVATR